MKTRCVIFEIVKIMKADIPVRDDSAWSYITFYGLTAACPDFVSTRSRLSDNVSRLEYKIVTKGQGLSYTGSEGN